MEYNLHVMSFVESFIALKEACEKNQDLDNILASVEVFGSEDLDEVGDRLCNLITLTMKG